MPTRPAGFASCEVIGGKMHWYLDVLKKYAVFDGRARRKEFWVFALVNLLATLILGFVDVATGLVSEQAGIGLFSGLYSLVCWCPTLPFQSVGSMTPGALVGGC